MRVRAMAVAMVALSAGGPAFAQDDAAAPAVGLLDIRPAEASLAPDAEKARVALESALGQFRVRNLADHPAVLAAHSAGADVALAAGIERAKARLKDARKAFEVDQDPVAAEKKFREAIDLFEANAAGLTTSEDLVGAYLFLSRIFFATQRELLIRDVFKSVVQLNPDLILDRAVYPGGMIKVYDEVKAQILASPLGQVRVESQTGVARVFLDGKDRGVTPLDLKNIPPGVHSLTIRRTGYAPFFQKAEVTSFRTDRISPALVPDRHPGLDLVVVPKGTETKDALGLTVVDYLDGVAANASLDVVIVGRLARAKAGPEAPEGALELTVRSYNAKKKELGETRTFTVQRGASLDNVAEALLVEAVDKSWMSPLAARRNLAAGGSATDPTAAFGVRASFAPGYRIAGQSRHFPRAPSAGFRAGFDFRLRGRIVLSAETGFDGLVQNSMKLEDTAGVEVDGGTGTVSAVYYSIPLHATARYYLGVRTWAPYATAGAGVTYDSLMWREPYRYDRMTSSSGLGLGAFAGAGVERALAARSALTLEVRASFDRPSVGDARVVSRNDGGDERTVAVDPGTGTGLRLSVGYLHLF